MSHIIEIVSVKDGKFHRPDDTVFNGGSNDLRNTRLMRCGRSLVPLNFFETVADANRYTGGRLEHFICQQCERKVTHLWRVPEVLKNGVGLFVGAGIPKGERVNTFIECGCCGAYHRTDFEGDCREDSERYYDLPGDAIVILDHRTECEECGHSLRAGDETHYPECSQIEVN